jgi:hypothetical protein
MREEAPATALEWLPTTTVSAIRLTTRAVLAPTAKAGIGTADEPQGVIQPSPGSSTLGHRLLGGNRHLWGAETRKLT